MPSTRMIKVNCLSVFDIREVKCNFTLSETEMEILDIHHKETGLPTTEQISWV